MPRSGRKEHTMELYEAMLQLQSKEECFQFFQDLCTPAEMLAMEQRYDVATKLQDGCTYIDIQDTTNASTATISRVVRLLRDENKSMLAQVIRRMKEN